MSRRVDVTGATRLEVDSGFDVRVSLGQAEAAVVRSDERRRDTSGASTIQPA